MSSLSFAADEAPQVAPSLRTVNKTFWLCCCYLLLVVMAEVWTATIGPVIGLTLHAVLLFGLLVQGALAQRPEVRALAGALALVPLCRLVSLALPLAPLPEPARSLAASIPLLVAAAIAILQLRLPRAGLGLHLTALPLQLLVGCGGLALGLLASRVIQPSAITGAAPGDVLLLPVLVLLIVAGFADELIFRGVLLAVAPPALRQWAPLFTSLLFAVVHSGYRSVAVVIFAFALGLLFSTIARLGRSILGLALAHGLMNITVYQILPLAAYNQHVAHVFGLAAALGALGALVGLCLLVWLARLRYTPGDEERAGLALRTLRRRQGLCYTELARRTGMSARTLAEIELGMRPAPPELAQLIANGPAPSPSSA